MSILWNPAAWTYIVFACVFAGFAFAHAPRDAITRMVLYQSVMLALAWWLDWPWFAMAAAVFVCTSTGLGAMYGFMRQVHSEGVRRSQDEVRRLAAASERERIGRDLHDLLGHTLSLITLKLELSRKLFDGDHEAARKELEDAEKVARQALAEVRAAVTGIRATDLAEELAAARVMLESSGVQLTIDVPSQPLPPELERVLALVVREASTNIARHAAASEASIRLWHEEKRWHMEIRDDGRGGVTPSGHGVIGMRDRIAMLGGRMTLESPRRKGTRIEVKVPGSVPAAVSNGVSDDEWLPHAGRGSSLHGESA